MMMEQFSQRKIQDFLLPQQKKIINGFEYYLDDTLGKGEYSKVFRGQNRQTGQEVAIKVIQNVSLDSSFSREMLHNEIQSLKTLNSPNILQFINYIYTPNNQYIITEYCNQGELKYNKNFTEKQLFHIFHNLLLALKEMKNKNIIHRDIKPPNILMHDGIPKLSDFGFSLNNKEMELQNQSSFGTPLYMAPESLLQSQYSYQSDVWSLGITFYELIYGHVPFYHRLESELAKIVYKYSQDQHLTIPESPFKIFLKGMLDPNPTTRFTVEYLLICFAKAKENMSNSFHQQQTFLVSLAQSLQKNERNLYDSCIRWSILKILLSKFSLNDTQSSQGLKTLRSIENTFYPVIRDQDVINLFNSPNDQQFFVSIRKILKKIIKDNKFNSLSLELQQFENILKTLED